MNQGIKYLKPSKKEYYIYKIKYTFHFISQSIRPRPNKLPISLTLYPLEKTNFFIKDFKTVKKICNILKKRKNNNITKFNKYLYYYHGYFEDAYSSGSFVINIFKYENKYIIEFQRRYGCCLQWYKHYRYMKEQIKDYL